MGKGRTRRAYSADAAADRYLKSVVSGRSMQRGAADPQSQAQEYRFAKQREEVVLAQTRHLLNCAGVSLCQRLTYTNFARHVDRLERNYSGRTLAILARMAVDRWQRYGLARDLLCSICLNVFNVTPLDGEPGVAGPGEPAGN